jgi:hypothetical protein
VFDPHSAKPKQGLLVGRCLELYELTLKLEIEACRKALRQSLFGRRAVPALEEVEAARRSSSRGVRAQVAQQLGRKKLT